MPPAAGRAWHAAAAQSCSLALPALGRQQRAAAVLGAAPAGILGLELLGVGLVDDQAVVVVELFAGLDVAQRLDEDPAVLLVGLAVRVAGVVDPARGVAADAWRRSPGFRRRGSRRYGSGPCGSCGWRRCASFQVMISPTYSMMRFALGDVLHGEDALAVDARAADLDALRIAGAPDSRWPRRARCPRRSLLFLPSPKLC